MLIERPPMLFRLTTPGALYRGDRERKKVYLTFDDGPIPEATPWVLDVLDRYGVKATFFMVGDNVRKYPSLYDDVIRRGHRVGNHTMHHLSGARHTLQRYAADVEEASGYVDSTLFRPPHGWLRPRQLARLRKRYRVVMFDVVTRDYSRRISADDVVENVKRYTRPGSVIVFHDSLRSIGKLHTALPRALEWLLKEGYTPELIE